MIEIVTAVYEKGMLRLLQPLNLRERQRVRIQVLLEEPIEGESNEEAAIRALVAEGALTPPSGRSDISISEQERLELANRLGSVPGKPLSEIIIEDRGEW